MRTEDVVFDGLARLEDELTRFAKASADSYTLPGLRLIIRRFREAVENLDPVVPPIIRKREFPVLPELEAEFGKLRAALEGKGLHVV